MGVFLIEINIFLKKDIFNKQYKWFLKVFYIQLFYSINLNKNKIKFSNVLLREAILEKKIIFLSNWIVLRKITLQNIHQEIWIWQ